MERCIKEFRLERLARLQTGERGLSLYRRGQLVIQTVPLNTGASRFVLPNAEAAARDFLWPQATSSTHRHNLEGILFYSVANNALKGTRAYTQVFRDGRLEMARGGIVFEDLRDSDRQVVSEAEIIEGVLVGVRRCLSASSKYGAAFPIVVMVSFLDAMNTSLNTQEYVFDSAETLDRSDLLFEPVVIESGQDPNEWDQLMLPVLDALWNAYGYVRCQTVRDRRGAWDGNSSR